MPLSNGDPIADAYAAYSGSGAGSISPQNEVAGAPSYDFRRPFGGGGMSGLGHSFGKFLRESSTDGLLHSASGLNDMLLSGGPVAGAAGYGAGGYGTGYLAGKLAELFGAEPGAASSWANIGGLAGLLGGGYAGYQHSKYATFGLDGVIAQQLAGDSSLSAFQRAQLLAQVRSLNDTTKQQIVQMIASLGSAAAAAVITRYLGGGLLSSAGAGLLGGWVGGNVFDRVSTGNTVGIRSNERADALGIPYLF